MTFRQPANDRDFIPVIFDVGATGELSATSGFIMIPTSVWRQRLVSMRFTALSVVTTNDGSNYWECRLSNEGGPGGLLDTSALSPGVAFALQTDLNIHTSGVNWLRVQFVKIGTPGNLSLPACGIWYSN